MTRLRVTFRSFFANRPKQERNRMIHLTSKGKKCVVWM
jgi:hypothetical protein